jgi:hypothetical protein
MWPSLRNDSPGQIEPEQREPCCSGSVPDFGQRSPAIYTREWALGGRFCQVCGHQAGPVTSCLAESATKGPFPSTFIYPKPFCSSYANPTSPFCIYWCLLKINYQHLRPGITRNAIGFSKLINRKSLIEYSCQEIHAMQPLHIPDQ